MKSFQITAKMWIDLEGDEAEDFQDGLNDAIIAFVESRNKLMVNVVSLQEINDDGTVQEW